MAIFPFILFYLFTIITLLLRIPNSYYQSTKIHNSRLTEPLLNDAYWHRMGSWYSLEYRRVDQATSQIGVKN